MTGKAEKINVFTEDGEKSLVKSGSDEDES